MTPNTQDGSFLLHMNKSTFSTQCFPNVQYTNQSNPGSEGNMHFVFAKPPCFFFISFTHFDSAGDGGKLSCWHFLPSGYVLVPPPSTLSKMHGWSIKKSSFMSYNARISSLNCTQVCTNALISRGWSILKALSKLAGRCMLKTANSQRWSIDTTERSSGWTVSY